MIEAGDGNGADIVIVQRAVKVNKRQEDKEYEIYIIRYIKQNMKFIYLKLKKNKSHLIHFYSITKMG